MWRDGSAPRRGCSEIQLLAVVAALAVLTPWGCHHDPSGAAGEEQSALRRSQDRIEVPADSPLRQRLRVAPVEMKEVRRTLDAPAEVEAEPARLARITPPLPGRVVQLYVRFGDTVTAGQPLVALDSPDLVAAQTDYLRGKSALAQAERTLSRSTDLRAQGVGSQREVDQAQTDRELTRSELDRAGLRLKLLGMDASALGRPLTVRSPIAGRVVDFKVAPGEYKSDLSQELMTIADLSTVWVTASVPEKDVRRVQAQEDACARFAAYPDEDFCGKVLALGDLLQPETRTVKVRMALQNPERRLKPGMFATVTFTERAAAELVVPTRAVVLLGDASFVFVELSPFVFQRRRVTPGGPLAGDLTFINRGADASLGANRCGATPRTEGLCPGERVVVENAVLLQ